MNDQKILIVDDKEENLYALKQVLKETGAEIICTHCGNEALAASLNHDFSMAILDVQMPQMDGYELADHLLSDNHTKNLPIIFLTAVYSDEDHVSRGYQSGAVDFVTKPYNPKIFLGKVNAFLERDKLMRALRKEVADREQAQADLQEKTAQLEAANRELESFSYSVSHDLQAPLRAIDGYARMLLHDLRGNPDAEIRRKLDVLRENSQKMSRLIDDLLAFSRLGRKSVSLSTVNMREMVRQVWDEISSQNSGRKMDLQIGDLPQTRGDHALLKQVVSNLLSNAVKFTRYREPAIIQISGKADGREIVYCIRDNGAGFNMDYYKKLFGVFQRLHDASEYEGTGVGLSIVQRIIRKHDGRVWAEGKVDEGATFYFSLPEKESRGSLIPSEDRYVRTRSHTA